MPFTSPVGNLSEADAMVVFGRIIRRARYRCDLSQRQLEWICAVDQTVISRLETGRVRHMRVQNVARVVAGLAGHISIDRGDEPLPGRAARRLPRSGDGV